MSTFAISEATTSDVGSIIGIAERTWWPTYSEILTQEQIRYMLDVIYAPERIRTQVAEREQTYLVLRDAEGPQGFAAFGKIAGDSYKIHKLYVLPGNQKKGYGRALIENIASRLRDAGIPFVELNVNRYNPAKTFYQKIGFQIIREEDIPIGPYWMNDYVMRLLL